MSQSHGTVQPVPPADLSSTEPTDVPEKVNALLADPIAAIIELWVTERFDKLGGDRDEGYYGFKRCKRRPYREQILEADNDTRLQSAVQEVADRYIARPDRRDLDNGKADGDK